MRIIVLLLAFAGIASVSLAQRFHIGLIGGVAAYNGDLTEKIIQKKMLNGVIGVTGNYELADQFMLRGGFSYARVGAADRYNKSPDLIHRNLSFETSVFELSSVIEYYLFNLNYRRYSPYAFVGVALFHYNPYAFDAAGQKTFLRPLSTEGEGIAGYPGRKPYHLTQPAIPFGAGLKFAVNDNLRIGIELGLRKLFTDYLDDVSSTYIDQTDLLNAKGQKAVDMAYRGDEVSGGEPVYPTKGAQRGNTKNEDTYRFAGIHLTYRLGGEKSGGSFSGKEKKGRFGCPVRVY